ncbi:MAG: hypothetical protein GX595_17430 [Lentisphaerae bacterium]|nr:hypothetical protein [Lentisphaerota bacterium]
MSVIQNSQRPSLTDRVFRGCVVLLVRLAAATGLTYEQVNVWIFCILWPALTLASLALNALVLARLAAPGALGRLTLASLVLNAVLVAVLLKRR